MCGIVATCDIVLILVVISPANHLGLRITLKLIENLARMLFGLLSDVGVAGGLHDDGQFDRRRDELQAAIAPCGLRYGGWGETWWFEGGGMSDGVGGGWA